VDEDGATEERQVVSRVEAVPERAEQKHGERAVAALIHHVTKPQARHLVPAVEKHLQARRKLKKTDR